MVSTKISLPVLGLLAVARAAPTTTNCSANSITSSIKWVDCPAALANLSTIPVNCAQFAVPLDYTDEESNETVNLDLIRVPATKQPAMGSILLNYGGPGLTSLATTADLAFVLNMFSGGRYDLVSFDPRGTAAALPFTCFSNDFEAQQLSEFSALFAEPQDREAMGKLWAGADIISRKCAAAQNKTGSLIGTAFVARDVISIATALGEKDKVRFWGFSYGTTLGATLISMFPEKMEGAILDGVQNPHEYYHADADYEEWTQSNQVFSAIFEHCIKNAAQCPLAHRAKTPAELEALYWSFYEQLRYNPIAFGGTVIDHFLLTGFSSKALYSPYSWPSYTKGIDMLMGPEEEYDVEFLSAWTGDGQAVDPAVIREAMRPSQALAGIHCSDRVNRISSLDEYMPVQQRLGQISRLMGAVEGPVAVTCAQWKVDAKERYEGDFHVAPRKPVLVVGNSFDGHTPIVSARNVSAGFEGSVVLEVNGYGHASIGLPSVCTVQKYSAYWVNGTMPEKGTVCEVEGKPWSNTTWVDIAKEIGWPVPEDQAPTAGQGAIAARMIGGRF